MANMPSQSEVYKFRPVTEQDRPALEKWIAADPHHNGVMEPEYFMGLAVNEAGETALDPRATCYAIEDSQGTVFFIRLSRASRVNIQFGPAASVRARKRVGNALLQGMAILEVALSRAGAEEWIFETQSHDLAEMAKKHLGFVASPDEMVRVILNVPAEQRYPKEVQ